MFAVVSVYAVCVTVMCYLPQVAAGDENGTVQILEIAWMLDQSSDGGPSGMFPSPRTTRDAGVSTATRPGS